MICLIFGFAVASYLQAMVLNLNLGVLDGTSIPWQSYSIHSILNIVVWCLIISVPFLILYFFKNAWKKIIKAVSFILIGMQLVALVTTIVSTPITNKTKEYYLSGEEQYTISSKSNVIVFILDYFSNTYVDKMLQEYPDALDAFNGFTYYNNVDCTYFGTFPSMNHMLTGAELDATITTEKWFESSWNSEKAEEFYSLLADNGYKVNIYSGEKYYGGAENMLGKVSNVSVEEITVNINYSELIKKMVQLSCYSHLPHAFKASFWMDTNDFSEVATVDSTGIEIKQQSSFYSALKEQGLTFNNQSNYFILQHLRGAHPAYNVNENGGYLKNATLEQTTKGYFLMVEEYLQQMKDLGVYDDSTIIITADHGDWENTQVIFFIKEAGKSQDDMDISTAPISHNDFMSTILTNIGEDCGDFGKPIYDFSENEERERTVWVRSNNSEYPSVSKYNSTAQGSANVYNVFTYTGDSTDLLEQMEDGPTEIIPMTDAFF